MTFSPLRIDFVSIQPNETIFDPLQNTAQIDALANTIVDLGGMVSIPVVKQVTIDEYALLSDHLEYYAYRKAREIHPRLPEQIEVFIANNKNEAAIQKQLETLQAIEATKSISSSKPAVSSSEIDLRIGNIESAVKNNQNAVINAIAQLKAEVLQEIAAQLPKPIPPLEAFNRILEPEVAYQVQRKLEFLGAKKAKRAVELLQEFSRSKDHKPFQSFADVIETLREPKKNSTPSRLIAEKKMLEIIDRWNG